MKFKVELKQPYLIRVHVGEPRKVTSLLTDDYRFEQSGIMMLHANGSRYGFVPYENIIVVTEVP